MSDAVSMIRKDMQQGSMPTSGTFRHTMLFLPIMEKGQEATLLFNTNWANHCTAPGNGAWTPERVNGGHSLYGSGAHDFHKKMMLYICTLKQIK